MKFNINNCVRVRLTEEGKEVYRNALRPLQGHGIDIEPKVDDVGYTRLQLWYLMSIFGDHLMNGGPNMFDTEIILETRN